MMYKKFVICFIILLFIILFSILFFKINPSNIKYSNEDIYALVQKGMGNMHDMQNVYIERNDKTRVHKFYYKGNKMKLLTMEDTDELLLSYSIMDLDKEKHYMVSDKKKIIVIKNETSFYKGLQYSVFDRINIQDSNLRRELSYIKDDNIEGKDCIFVKEITYYKTDDGSFKPDDEFNTDICAYWIEKSTGFVLGTAIIKPTQTNAIPEVWIKDITFNKILDS